MHQFFKNIMITTTAALLATACQSETSTEVEPDLSISSADVQTIMTWWNGDYNNDAQITELKADGRPIWQKDVEGQTLGGHLPITSHYRPVDMPAFGDNVLYVEEKTFGEDGNPYRQRLYTINHDGSSNVLSVKLWSFKDKETYLEAWQDLTRISGVTPEDMSPLPDQCDLHVSKTKDARYEMKMPNCVFGTTLFDYQVSLGADTFWSRDRIVDAETGVVKTSAGGFTYHKLDKQ